MILEESSHVDDTEIKLEDKVRFKKVKKNEKGFKWEKLKFFCWGFR